MTDNEQIKAIIKQYAEKGKRLYAESYNEKKEKYAIGFWDGYKSCADGLLKELEDMQEEPKFKIGDKVTYCNEEYVVYDITDHYILQSVKNDTSVPTIHIDFGNEDYELTLVEEYENRFPSFEESQGECHPFQDIALNR